MPRITLPNRDRAMISVAEIEALRGFAEKEAELREAQEAWWLEHIQPRIDACTCRRERLQLFRAVSSLRDADNQAMDLPLAIAMAAQSLYAQVLTEAGYWDMNDAQKAAFINGEG
jgi:hypothetical protein